MRVMRSLAVVLCVGVTIGSCKDEAGSGTKADPGPEEVAESTDTPTPEPDALAPDDTQAPDADTAEPPKDAAEPDTAQPDIVEPTGECPDFTAQRRAYFGDLHVHTSYSFDAYGFRNTKADPAAALQFARGEEIAVPPFDDAGSSERKLKLRVPLDFAAVTDHSEFLGEVSICLDPDATGYNSVSCAGFREFTKMEDFVGTNFSFAGWGATIAVANPQRLAFCKLPGADCEGAAANVWSQMNATTKAADDPCTFTTLHGYEWTGTASGAMNHRNVIFRNDHLPDRPVTYYDTQNWHDLALQLREGCIDAGTGCDVLAIPHNPNYSQGTLFEPVDRDGLPLTAETAALRAEMEPILEMMQVKGESECRNGFSRYPAAADEYCSFEKKGGNVPMCAEGETPCKASESPEKDGCVACVLECKEGETATGCVAPTDYTRNILKLGLEELVRMGVNPFQLGFIASTDTHNATPGAVDEDTFIGHHGMQDDEPKDMLGGTAVSKATRFWEEENPGGLAAVYAEENTREAIFQGLRRREAYATSGTRIGLRVFGGWAYPDALCDSLSLVEDGYAGGVPMGAELPPSTTDGTGPRFVVHAMKDPGTAAHPGTQLQQIHIVKVWVDADGKPQEKVFDVTPDKDYSATVSTETCQTSGPGKDTLCAVWQDPEFDAARPAAYYTRVLEVPTCRWQTYVCLQAKVDCSKPLQAKPGCCDEGVPKTIRERAWSSPIWYVP